MRIPLWAEGARGFSPPATQGVLLCFSVSARLREQKPCRSGLSARTRPRGEQAYAAAGPPAREREGSDWQEASSPRVRHETRPVSQ